MPSKSVARRSSLVARKFFIVICVCVLSLVCLAERAALAIEGANEDAAQSDERRVTSDERRPLKEALDRRYRFSKRMQNEINLYGGDYLGDEWLNTWDAGGRYAFHFNDVLALGASYMYSWIRANSSTSFGASLTTTNSHIISAEITLSNDCAFRSGHTIIECDLFLTLGPGAIYINRMWKPSGILGGGMKIYTPLQWLSVRFDVDTILHDTPIPGSDRFNSDLVMNVGLSFVFPIRKAAPQQDAAE